MSLLKITLSNVTPTRQKFLALTFVLSKPRFRSRSHFDNSQAADLTVGEKKLDPRLEVARITGTKQLSCRIDDVAPLVTRQAPAPLTKRDFRFGLVIHPLGRIEVGVNMPVIQAPSVPTDEAMPFGQVPPAATALIELQDR